RCQQRAGQGCWKPAIKFSGLARNTSGITHPAADCDVTSSTAVGKIASDLRKSGKKIQALINVAGIASMNLALATPQQSAKKQLETNLLGVMNCCRLFAPLIIRNKGGNIVNFTTIAVKLGLAGESAYVAAKAGIEGYSRVLAREMADFSITVNCIAPGPIRTDLLQGVSERQITALVEQQIIRKEFTPDAVCDIVELLLDRRAHCITGQVIHVGGA
ncbi:MAG: SDR family NAD(P)-dependent oxidoreductase, partial [Betaproteobacteria bacterium]|nr:SDR family NAD(P)-dependent oxidoreductase [Betaproteobacteria bacterium]